MSSNNSYQRDILGKSIQDFLPSRQVEDLFARKLESEISKLKGDEPDTLVANIPGALTAARAAGVPFKVDAQWRIKVPGAVSLPFERFLVARRNRIENYGDNTSAQNKTEESWLIDVALFHFLAKYDRKVDSTEKGEDNGPLIIESDKRSENEMTKQFTDFIHGLRTKHFIFMPLLLLVVFSVLFS